MSDYRIGDRIVVNQDVEFFNFDIMDYCGFPQRRTLVVEDVLDACDNIGIFLPYEYDEPYKRERKLRGDDVANAKFSALLKKIKGTTKLVRVQSAAFYVNDIERHKQKHKKTFRTIFSESKTGKFTKESDLETLPDYGKLHVKINEEFIVGKYWPHKFSERMIVEIEIGGQKNIVRCTDIIDNVELS